MKSPGVIQWAFLPTLLTFLPALIPVARAQCVIADPCSFTFSATAGQNPAPQPLTIIVEGAMYYTTITSANTTANGIQWLSVTPSSGTLGGALGGAPTVRPTVGVSSAGLPAGTYTGNIFLSVTISGGGTRSANLPVALTVAGGSGSPTITFDRSSVALTATAGGSPVSQSVVLSTGVPATFSASVSSAGGWLSIAPNSGSTNPTATLAITANPANLKPGPYVGTVTVTLASAAQSLGVSLTVTSPPGPQIARVVNAASALMTPIAPSLILNIFGTGLGPAELVRAVPAGNVFGTGLASVQVVVNDIPAPLLYVRSDQIGALAPYAVTTGQSATIQVEYAGAKSNSVTLPVAGSAPALFTSDQSGTGQGAILNQDGTLNAPGNPASQESVVVLFLTGGGKQDGFAGDGVVVQNPPYPKLSLPVTASVGGRAVPAENIQYAGAAPEAVEGLIQINLKLPPGVSGQVPVVVNVGDVASQAGVTLSVR